MSKLAVVLVVSLFCSLSFSKTHDCVVKGSDQAEILFSIDLNAGQGEYVPDIEGNDHLGKVIPLLYDKPTGKFYYLSLTADKTVINLGISNVIKRQNIGNFILSAGSLNYIGYNDHTSGATIGCKAIDLEL